MEQPQGFVDSDHSDQVCLLKKAIYGLKQASCAWSLQFHEVLLTGRNHQFTLPNQCRWQRQDIRYIRLYAEA